MIKFDYDIKIKEDLVEKLFAEIKADKMGGWFTLPTERNHAEFTHIRSAAARIHSNSKYLVCIGIGGSYLGHRAVIEALRPTSPTKVLFAGNSLSASAINRVLKEIGDADFSINVISKSGTTTEPAIAFRIFKEKLIEKYGENGANNRIYATTDENHGALHDEAITKGYERFVVPDNIGGRYSVFSAVGLLPLAVAGVDIDALLSGAASLDKNVAAKYGFVRHALYKTGHETEILASFEPDMLYLHEWWKQLFGESEGKNQSGIFPASVIYTTDLHSLGQYLQDGRRNIFETIVKITTATENINVPATPDNLDGLDYLEGRSINYINEQALNATVAAHKAGGIPVLEIEMPNLTEQAIGALIFFFEIGCAVSAKLSKVNPFDQPGVEAYKTEMFKLLGKPGF